MSSVWYQIKAIPCPNLTSWCRSPWFIKVFLWNIPHLWNVTLIITQNPMQGIRYTAPFCHRYQPGIERKTRNCPKYKPNYFWASQFYILILFWSNLLWLISSLHDVLFCSSVWTRKCLVLHMRFKKSPVLKRYAKPIDVFLHAARSRRKA